METIVGVLELIGILPVVLSVFMLCGVYVSNT